VTVEADEVGPETQPGEPTLYLVATPIGNLGDISFRAIETLKQVDLVAAEDTRVTGRLLKHYGIKRPLMSFFEHNQARATEEIVQHLIAGRSVALVTTAGTPGIADPGFTVVRRAIDEGLRDDDPRRIGSRHGAGAVGAPGSQLHLSRLHTSQTGRPPALFHV
jgi:hypothetical protein